MSGVLPMRSSKEVPSLGCLDTGSMGNCSVHSGCARLKKRENLSKLYSYPLRQEAAMSRKSSNPNFDQTLEILRAHGFDVAPYAGVAGGVLVSKHGAAAVIAPSPDKNAPAAFVESPGA